MISSSLMSAVTGPVRSLSGVSAIAGQGPRQTQSDTTQVPSGSYKPADQSLNLGGIAPKDRISFACGPAIRTATSSGSVLHPPVNSAPPGVAGSGGGDDPEYDAYIKQGLLAKIPLFFIGAFNVNLSYIISLGLRYYAEHHFPGMADSLPWLFYGDQANLDFFRWEDNAARAGIATTWLRTNMLGLGIGLPVFAGAELFLPRNPKHRRWLYENLGIQRAETAISSFYSQATQSPQAQAIDAALSRWFTFNQYSNADGAKAGGFNLWSRVKESAKIGGLYTREQLRRGIMGCKKLVGARWTTELPRMVKVKNTLKSQPVTHASHALIEGAFFTALAAKKRTYKDTGLAPEEIEQRLETDINEAFTIYANVVGGTDAVTKLPDGLLQFFGIVTPDRAGQIAGFTTDILANSALDISYAKIFNSTKALSELIFPGLLISALVGYANTKITQHQGFNYSQQFIQRTGIGILKSGVYRGFCSIDTIQLWFNLLVLQLGYGLAATAYAQYVTVGFNDPNTASVDNSDVARKQLFRQKALDFINNSWLV